MKYVFAILSVVVAAVGCHSSRNDFLANAEERQSEAQRQSEGKQFLRAFGGTLVGSDRGEWGGNVEFREPGENARTVIADNSHGLFAMPFGVVAVTGLSHLGMNDGSIYAIRRGDDSRVQAALLMKLPGAPCDVIREGDHITMRLLTGHEDLPGRKLIYSCYALEPDGKLAEYACPVSQEPYICAG